MAEELEGLLLGKNTPVVEVYSPELLYPIPRSLGRENILQGSQPSFHGVDLWHAYELSWLNGAGVPRARVGRFFIPATSPNLVESKSFKLYLNSLNGVRFQSDEDARRVIIEDISSAAGAPVELELFSVDAAALGGKPLDGHCIDDTELEAAELTPSSDLLVCAENRVEETLYSHLLRSLCPVTGQPDWATVWIHYRGPQLDRAALLQYVIAFRQHQEFHEQCVERMFVDIESHCETDFLELQAFYTRRGGLDINPYRSSEAGGRALPRMDRQ